MKMPLTESFREQLRSGKTLIGTFITLPSPEVGELLAGAGFDWLFLDMEHAPFSVRDIQHIVRAASPCPCVVRTPSADDVWIKKALDTGTAGIIIPHVNSAETAVQIVRSAKYPPLGTRSAGISRAQGYGSRFQEYLATANDQIAVILQIEEVGGVSQIDSIVRVPGVDAVFVGPYDLSGSLGKPGRVDDKDVMEEIEKLRKACRSASIPIGVFGVNADAVMPYIDRGFTLIAAGSDTLLLIESAGRLLDNIQRS